MVNLTNGELCVIADTCGDAAAMARELRAQCKERKRTSRWCGWL